jgi:hypothetical protein
VKEAPVCVICTTGRWTPGNSGCLCPPPFVHLKTHRVYLRDQPVIQVTSTGGGKQQSIRTENNSGHY